MFRPPSFVLPPQFLRSSNSPAHYLETRAVVRVLTGRVQGFSKLGTPPPPQNERKGYKFSTSLIVLKLIVSVKIWHKF